MTGLASPGNNRSLMKTRMVLGRRGMGSRFGAWLGCWSVSSWAMLNH